MLNDTYRHKGMRRNLVDDIRKKGIKDESVLKAIDTVPRHLFMDSSFLEYAYEDKPFPIGAGQTISQPFTVAYQTELLRINKGEKVLEVGTGSGYQTCVLIELGAKVYTIERQKNLYLKAKELFAELGYNPVILSYGDGYKGLPVHSPFDKIIVTAGAPSIPEALKYQLKIGGSMVIPVGISIQIMIRVIRSDADNFIEEEHGTFRFVPLLENRATD
jgi:protein-L-isoaspartate(D-aspartate) O-methyltransferase